MQLGERLDDRMKQRFYEGWNMMNKRLTGGDNGIVSALKFVYKL